MGARLIATALGLAAVVACSFDGTAPTDPPANDAGAGDASVGVSVSGTIVEWDPVYPWQAGQPAAGVTLSLVIPAGDDVEIVVDGSTFTISNIIPGSAFAVAVSDDGIGGADQYFPTISQALSVEDQDVTDAVLEVVRQDFIDDVVQIQSQTPGDGLIAARVDSSDRVTNVIGIPPSTFADISQDTVYVAADGSPSASLQVMGDNGAVVLVNVETIVHTIELSDGTYTLAGNSAIVRPDHITIVDIDSGGDPPDCVGDVNDDFFEQQVVPIFSAKSCNQEGCHNSNNGGPVAGFDLVGDASDVYGEVMQNSRVLPNQPYVSPLLTKPGFEEAVDGHPQAIFLSRYDPDYVKICKWIATGAPVSEEVAGD